MTDTPQYLYIMGSSRDGPLKIGIAKDPRLRAKTLQTGAARELHLYWVYPCPRGVIWEEIAHRILRPQRLKGEWFDIPIEQAISVLWAASLAYMQETAPDDELIIDYLQQIGGGR